jgi:flagellar basal-body rod protein FlgF
MNSGIYTAYSGMQAQADALDVLANNLANVNTTGFKEGKAFFALLQQSVSESENQNALQAAVNKPVTAQSTFNGETGFIKVTQRDLDVAIEGDGFMVVQTPQGIRYTRNGNLHMNSKGVLTTSDGFPVLGAEKKPITLGPGQICISERGDIQLRQMSGQGESQQGGIEVDRLKLVRFEDLSSLKKEGSSLFVLPGGQDTELESNAKIRVGCLEESNVNPVQAVVHMVSILRNFEAIQKSMNLITNDMNKQAIEKLSR